MSDAVATLTTHTDPYLTYVLQNPDSVVEIVPERGGILTRWQWQGREIFYMDHERFQDPTLTVRGGIPILFPICGNLPDNQFIHQGKPYTLKQHGLARSLPWTVVDQSTDPELSVTVQLESDAETLLAYPFPFRVQFTYVLTGSHLLLRQRYINTGSEVMPFATGLHPYFAVQDKTGLKLGIPASQLFDYRAQQQASYAGGFDFDVDEIDVALAPLSEAEATVRDPQMDVTLTLTYSEQYSTLVFWTVKGKPFYCLEPWTSPRNAMISGDHLLHLDPGAELVTEVGLHLSAAE